MKKIVLDTCTIFHVLKNSAQAEKCLALIKELDDEPNLIISVVTKAELTSIMKQNKWGENKVDKANQFLDELVSIDINSTDIELIQAYTSIDGFTKRKLKSPSGNMLKGSAKKMGKNDLWIAATAYILRAPLITTDGDFDILNDEFIQVLRP